MIEPKERTPPRWVLWLAKPKVQTQFNGAMTVIWLVMMPITLLFIGPFSTVLWVSFISAWALFATHLGAWIAALVNVKAERIDDRTEDALHFDRIEAADTKRDAILEALTTAAADRSHADLVRDAVAAKVEQMEAEHGTMLAAMHALLTEVHGATVQTD